MHRFLPVIFSLIFTKKHEKYINTECFNIKHFILYTSLVEIYILTGHYLLCMHNFYQGIDCF